MVCAAVCGVGMAHNSLAAVLALLLLREGDPTPRVINPMN